MSVVGEPVARVRLSLESRPESVALVRTMLAGAGDELVFGPELLADLKTAVSEACNNVVVHAYRDGEPGPMTITLEDREDSIVITVAVEGAGLVADAPPSDGLGVGLAVIDALVSRSEFRSAPGRGTEVEMEFARSRDEVTAADSDLTAPDDPVEIPRISGPPAPDAVAVAGEVPQAGEILLRVDPAGLLGGVLSRVAGAVAAESSFSIDRYSEVALVTDSIAAHARSHATSPHIVSRLRSADRRLEVEVGPFRTGSVAHLQSSPGNASPALLSMLVDDLSVEGGKDSEQLRMVLTDSRHGDAVPS